MDTKTNEEIKIAIKKAVESGIEIDKEQEIFVKINEVFHDLDFEDYEDIYLEFLADYEQKIEKEKPKEEPKPQKITKNEHKEKHDTQVIHESEISIVTDKITNVENQIIDDTTKKAGEIVNINSEPLQLYAKQRIEELVGVLSELVTAEHFVDIPTSQGKKRISTSLVAVDLLSMMTGVEVDVKTMEYRSFTGDVKVSATTTIYDKKRDFRISGITCEEFIEKRRYDPLTKKEHIEYGDSGTIETAITRSIRNAVFKFVPKKILNMIYDASKRKVKEIQEAIKKESKPAKK